MHIKLYILLSFLVSLIFAQTVNAQTNDPYNLELRIKVLKYKQETYENNFARVQNRIKVLNNCFDYVYENVTSNTPPDYVKRVRKLHAELYDYVSSVNKLGCDYSSYKVTEFILSDLKTFSDRLVAIL